MESTELLRHLCEHGCYLRAFAPRREWCSLRAEIYHTKPTGVGTKINESIGKCSKEPQEKRSAKSTGL